MPNHLNSRPNKKQLKKSEAACTQKSIPAKKRVRSSALLKAFATKAGCSRYRNVDTQVIEQHERDDAER